MINVIQRAFAFFQLEQILCRRDQIFLGQNAAVALHAQFLIDLVTTNATEVIAFFVEEQTLDERAGIRCRRGISRTQATVNIFQRLNFILGRIFLETLDHVAFVHRSVHDLDFGDAEFGNLLDDGLRERLESARHNQTFFFVHRVMHEHAILQIFNFFRFLHRQFLDGVEQLQNFFVRAAQQTRIFLRLAALFFFLMVEERKCTEERRRQKFTAAFFTVEINVEQIARVEHRFIPRTAIRNYAEAVEHFAIRMLGRFKSNARRAVQLRDDHAFRTINAERALRRHERKFAHENFFFLRALAFILQQERDIQRRAISCAFAEAFQPVHFRRTNLVRRVIEHDFAVVTLDRKYFAEN